MKLLQNLMNCYWNIHETVEFESTFDAFIEILMSFCENIRILINLWLKKWLKLQWIFGETIDTLKNKRWNIHETIDLWTNFDENIGTLMNLLSKILIL